MESSNPNGDETYVGVSEESTKLVAESHLKEYVHFMTSYSTQLFGIEGALGCESGNVWDKRINPISLQTKEEEKISLPNLITTDNKILNKVLIALSGLCIEINLLEDEAKKDFYNQLLYYGEVDSLNDDRPPEGNEQLQIGRMLPLLQKLLCFVQRCREVLKNVIQQLAALYNKSLPKVIDASQIHFTAVFEHIGSLLRILLTIDEICINNTALKGDWTLYKGMLKSVRHNIASFDITVQNLRPLEKLASKIESLVINGKVLRHCLDQDFDDSGIPVAKNSMFIDEYISNIKLIYARLEPRIGDNTDRILSLEYVNLCSLLAFYSRLFHNIDKKLFKQLWELSRKLPCVCLLGNVVWFPDIFFSHHIPSSLRMIDSRMLEQAKQARKGWLANKVTILPRDCQSYFYALNNWMVRMTSNAIPDLSLDDLSTKCQLYLEGIGLAARLRHTIDTVLNLHVFTEQPMTVNVVLLLCRMITMTKAAYGCFHQHSPQLTQSSLHIIQHLQYQLLSSAQSLKRKVVSDKRYSDRRLDMLSGIVLFCNCINGSSTAKRVVVAKLALAVANQSRIIREDEYTNLLTKISQLSLVGSEGILQAAHESANQSSFYWHRTPLLSTYFSNLCHDSTDSANLHLMFAALEDCVMQLASTKHLNDCKELVGGYKNDILEEVKISFLDKICKLVENDLRLSVHSHLKLDDRNPFRVGLKSLRQVLALHPIKFMDEFIDIRAYITHYLDQTFYNLTTVALHDWRTYGEMRNIAAQKYHLYMQEVHLPNQQLEQGLDILEIMRNIHVFVSKYLYNLNNQVFVESTSNNKHLNTINIRHIANSIRTHGTGIMNTTVNFTFQFLKKKFFIFSQFLFDEHIKSRLVKDIREFRANHEALKQQYPYEFADRFNRGIRKLGLAPDGSTFLDQFRLLISHIGNAMGYIRMVRTGGLHFCSEAISFVPDLEDLVNFEELAKADDISPEVTTSFTQFDSSVGLLAKNAAEGSDYLHMLVDVFAPEFRSKKNMHLRNFYVIIPALTINFVEHIISCKEKMNKKNKVGAAFTDDGFAMGLAYILKLLDQNSEFDALHWFHCVRRKYAGDAAQQGDQQQGKKATMEEAEKLQQTQKLALTRINIYRREFDLLYYSLSSARIFFRSDDRVSQPKQKPEESTPASDETPAASDAAPTSVQ